MLDDRDDGWDRDDDAALQREYEVEVCNHFHPGHGKELDDWLIGFLPDESEFECLLPTARLIVSGELADRTTEVPPDELPDHVKDTSIGDGVKGPEAIKVLQMWFHNWWDSHPQNRRT